MCSACGTASRGEKLLHQFMIKTKSTDQESEHLCPLSEWNCECMMYCTFTAGCIICILLERVHLFGVCMYVRFGHRWGSWYYPRLACQGWGQCSSISPHSAIGPPGLHSGATPGHLSQGRTQRILDGHPIWPQYSHTVSVKQSSAMGAGRVSVRTI